MEGALWSEDTYVSMVALKEVAPSYPTKCYHPCIKVNKDIEKWAGHPLDQLKIIILRSDFLSQLIPSSLVEELFLKSIKYPAKLRGVL